MKSRGAGERDGDRRLISVAPRGLESKRIAPTACAVGNNLPPSGLIAAARAVTHAEGTGRRIPAGAAMLSLHCYSPTLFIAKPCRGGDQMAG
ncbi:MAG: hypothetical protein AMXMBFR47_00900 [Planctomycetota bacterium]